MKNQISFLIAACICLASIGCSVCCGPYDYDYPDFGGKHQRQDRRYGRVGSILSDPLAPRAGGASADSNLLPAPPLKSTEPIREDSEPDGDDEEMDDIKRDLDDIDDLEDITPLESEELPSLDDLEDRLDKRNPINKKTRLNRNRPLR